jgi:hypothetical protein
MNHFRISNQKQLDRLVSAIAVHAPYKLPLYRAIRSGEINLVQPERCAELPAALLQDRKRAVVILIGDDDGVETGPPGWVCTKTLQRWGLGALIHGAGGEAEHYQFAVTGALLVRRFVIVECASIHQPAWELALAPLMGTLTIRASGDGLHPKPPAQGEVH